MRQQHFGSCVVACLAMVFGTDFATMDAATRAYRHPRGGISYDRARDFLITHGVLCHTRYCPPFAAEPFGRIHLVAVDGVLADLNHAVVMTASGVVLDPEEDEPLDLSRYARVRYVAALQQM